MNNADWDGLRFILAVARSGSAAAAARALDVTHSTVLRRVQAIEEDYGLRIFDRSAGRYAVAPQGRALVELAASFESSIIDVRRRAAGQRACLEGVVRFTTTEALMDSLLPPLLAGFCRLHPAVVLELVVTNARLDLERRDADVTLRPSAQPPEALVGMRLSRLGFALYAAAAVCDSAGACDLATMDWLLLDGELAQSPVGQWLRTVAPSEQVVFKADSFVALRRMAEAGLGVVALPCLLADGSPLLRRVGEVAEDATTQLWVLTHADLRNAALINAFMQHLASGIRAQRKLIEGG